MLGRGPIGRWPIAWAEQSWLVNTYFMNRFLLGTVITNKPQYTVIRQTANFHVIPAS